MRVPQLVLYCIFLILLNSLSGQVRTWENLDGQKIVAELIRVEDDSILLRLDGMHYWVQLKELSENDRNFIEVWQQNRRRTISPREQAHPAERDFSRPQRGTKKGFCIANRRYPDWQDRLKALNITWFYNWTSREPEGIPEGIEFVPMIFGHAAHLGSGIERIIGLKGERGYLYVLGHNEPDSTRQANRTVEEVLNEWPQLMEIGLPLISPGAVQPDGEWMKAFMEGVEERGLRVDFIAVHSYGGANAQAFLDRMERIYRMYGRPIWITEFGVGDWRAETVAQNRHSPERVEEFMRQVLPELERRRYIYRYSWYNATPDNPALGTSALFDEEGNLTPLGEIYARH